MTPNILILSKIDVLNDLFATSQEIYIYPNIVKLMDIPRSSVYIRFTLFHQIYVFT